MEPCVVMTVKNGKIEEIRSELHVDDVGGEINGIPRMKLANEASPDISVWQYPRYRNLLPQVDITALTPDELVAEVFAADFSCIWGVRICRSFRLRPFPTMAKLKVCNQQG
jgi:hypothetical protein